VQSVRVGLSAGAVAVGARSVWVASALDGTVSKVDPRRMRVVDTARVGNAPQGLAYGDGRVWVTVAAGGGRALSGPTIAGAGGGIGALPEAVCGPVIHAGSKPPQRLIAADLPLDQVDATVTLPMAQAIEFVLRQRHFRAGAYRIGLQVCDDSTAQAQAWTPGKCQADAKLFATTPTVIGVIGPYNSGCAEQEIPITNRAGLAMVSPTNSYIGLTRAGPGAAPGDPGRLYPTSTRTYFRVYPPDNAEAAAEALLAHQLGLRRIFVVRDPDPYYGAAVAGGFARTAPKVGVQPVGATQWQPSQLASPSRATAANRVHAHALAELIRQSHADGVVLAGVASSYPNAVLTRLQQSLGPRIVFIADDAFLTQRVAPVVPNLTNFYICAASITDPTHQLPSAGRRFLNAFRATQPGRAADIYSPFAAQAAEVLLEAIAHSNATRASVLQELATTNVRDGILGRFGFDRNGDIDRDRIGIYRATGSTLKLDRTITVPSQLLGG
jgi:branched-chain amino acid transport system substrate-binding protein